MDIGYTLRLEHSAPAAAVELAVLAEAAGFRGTVASDRFQPRLPRFGHAPFAWGVIGATGARTTGSLGVVTSPGYRMHPAVVAQAAATTGALFPDRFWLGIGAGEALNEHVVGGYWPELSQRIERMFEAIDMIKRLFASGISGRDTSFAGRFHTMESARVWTMPERAPRIAVATRGPVTAKRAGRAVDGIVTMESPLDRLEHLFQRFDEGRREAGRSGEPALKVVQVHVSWAQTRAEAVGNAMSEWPHAAIKFPLGDVRSPHELAQLARSVRPEDFGANVFISEDLQAHRAHLQRFADLGATAVHVHNVGPNQREFLEAFGREVLPALTR